MARRFRKRRKLGRRGGRRARRRMAKRRTKRFVRRTQSRAWRTSKKYIAAAKGFGAIRFQMASSHGGGDNIRVVEVVHRSNCLKQVGNSADGYIGLGAAGTPLWQLSLLWGRAYVWKTQYRIKIYPQLHTDSTYRLMWIYCYASGIQSSPVAVNGYYQVANSSDDLIAIQGIPGCKWKEIDAHAYLSTNTSFPRNPVVFKYTVYTRKIWQFKSNNEEDFYTVLAPTGTVAQPDITITNPLYGVFFHIGIIKADGTGTFVGDPSTLTYSIKCIQHCMFTQPRKLGRNVDVLSGVVEGGKGPQNEEVEG